jgi:hypothetical protein
MGDDEVMTTPAASGQLTLSIVDRPDEVRSLLGWLRREDGLRGRVDLKHVDPPVDGQMGSVLDVLTVALGSGGAGAVLAGSLSTWLTSRRPDVRVTITGRHGREIEVDGRRVPDVAELIREIERLIDPADRSR